MRRVVILALLFSAAPALAQEQAAASKPDLKAEKKVCRDMTPTGSRVPKRECRTKSEWASIDAANADENLLARSQRQNGRL